MAANKIPTAKSAPRGVSGAWDERAACPCQSWRKDAFAFPVLHGPDMKEPVRPEYHHYTEDGVTDRAAYDQAYDDYAEARSQLVGTRVRGLCPYCRGTGSYSVGVTMTIRAATEQELALEQPTKRMAKPFDLAHAVPATLAKKLGVTEQDVCEWVRVWAPVLAELSAA